MNWLWSGIFSAIGAWFLNKLVVKYWGWQGTVWVAPFVEEILKTGTALILHGDIVLSHGAFGAVEAVYDVNTSPQRGVSAALASFIGHLLFGFISQTGYFWRGGSFAAAVLLGSSVHVVWNLFVSLFSRETM